MAGAIAVAGTLLGLSMAVWHRLRLRQAIEAEGWSLRGLIGLGLVPPGSREVSPRRWRPSTRH